MSLTTALGLLLLCAEPTLPKSYGTPGYNRPHPGTLQKVFGMRYARDLSSFELLKATPEEWSRPLISPDGVRAYIGTRTGHLRAIDIGTGEQLWARDDMGAIGASMFVYRGHVVLGSDSKLVGLDEQIGGDRFSINLGGFIGGEMTRSGTVAIIPVRPNNFIAVDLEKREQLWRVRRPTPDGITIRGQGTPAIDRRNNRAFLGFSDGSLIAVALDSGRTLWSANLGRAGEFFADVDAAPIIVDGGKAIIVAAYNGGLFKIGTERGNTIWKRDIFRLTALVRAGAGLLVAAHGDGQVLGLYPSDGRVRWRYKMKKGAPSLPVYVGRSKVVVGGSEGPIALLDTDTGRPLQIVSPGSGLSVPPAYEDPALVILSNQGLLMVMSYGRGTGTSQKNVGDSFWKGPF